GSAIVSATPALVIATPLHVQQIEERLAVRGIDLELARDSGRYVVLDAQRTMDSFLVEGWPDAQRFNQIFAQLLNAHSAGDPPVIFGEMVALLWSEGKHAAAVCLEQLWNQLSRRYTFSLLCAYSIQRM